MALSEVFLSFLISSIIACILALGQYVFKSKCDEIKCCCIKIHRKVELESQIEEQIIELPPQLQPKKTNLSLDSVLKK
jgi:hypothetical protein